MKDLLEAARSARENAYAPYSGYAVGAALRSGNQVFSGANVENGAYGSTMCAERVAVFAMATSGGRKVDEILLLTEDGAAPCGACLQVLAEFVPDGQSLPVHLADASGTINTYDLDQFLPSRFESDALNRTEPA